MSAASWVDTINECMMGNKRCFAAAVGDATTGYLYAHSSTDDDYSFPHLYSGESYNIESLSDDCVSKVTHEICETTLLKELLEGDKCPAQGIHMGGKKYQAIKIQELPAKSYPDVSVKACIIALDKVNGCIATAGGYYVIGLIDTKVVDQKNLAVELACDMAAYLTRS